MGCYILGIRVLQIWKFYPSEMQSLAISDLQLRRDHYPDNILKVLNKKNRCTNHSPAVMFIAERAELRINCFDEWLLTPLITLCPIEPATCNHILSKIRESMYSKLLLVIITDHKKTSREPNYIEFCPFAMATILHMLIASSVKEVEM